ncbi:MAG: hypothetical protein IMY86_07620, partial [Chloroflexi bacterium]|nr:hypothetical protein [Chloroflexota bacterium]
SSRRIRIISWIISLLVVVSMGFGMAVTLIPPRRVTPTPTSTPVTTHTPTPVQP